MSCSTCGGCSCTCPTEPRIVEVEPASPGSNCATAQLWEQTDIGYIMPAVDSSITLLVCDSSQYVVGMTVWVVGFGFLQITDIPDGTHITVENTGNSQNATGGDAIPQGTKFAAGIPEQLVQLISSFFLSDFTTSAFTMPAVLANVNVPVTDTNWARAGMLVYVQTAGFMTIIAVVDSLNLTLQNNGDANNAASTTLIATSRYIFPAACCSGAVPGANTVTNAMLAKIAALKVKGNPTNALADPTDFGPTVALQYLRANAGLTALEWAVLSSIANSMLATMPARTVKANVTNAVAVPTDSQPTGALQYFRSNSANTALEWAAILQALGGSLNTGSTALPTGTHGPTGAGVWAIAVFTFRCEGAGGKHDGVQGETSPDGITWTPFSQAQLTDNVSSTESAAVLAIAPPTFRWRFVVNSGNPVGVYHRYGLINLA